MREALLFIIGVVWGINLVWLSRQVKYIIWARAEKRFHEKLKRNSYPIPDYAKGVKNNGEEKIFGREVISQSYHYQQTDEQMLKQCLNEENFELAAIVRDRIEANKK